MSDPEFEIPNVDVVVPPRCVGCANVCALLDHINSHVQIKEVITEKVQSDEPEQFIEQIAEHLQAVDPEITIDKDDMSKQLLQGTAETLNQMDECIEQTRDSIGLLTLGCEGLLKMRASRGGKTYQADVCTSLALPTGTNQEAVFVHRTDA